MKKILNLIILVVLMICFFSIPTNAAYTMKIKLSPSKTELKKGDEVIIEVSVIDFPAGFSGIIKMATTLEYDKTVFDTVAQSNFTSQNNWKNLTYNPTTGEIKTVNSEYVKVNQTVFILKLKVKNNVSTSATPMVTFKDTDVNGMSAESILLEKKDLTFKIIEENVVETPTLITNTITSTAPTQNTITNTTTTNTTNTVNTTNITNTTNTINTIKNTTTKDLPKTGIEDFFVPGLMIISLVGIISFIKYKNTIIE